MVGYIRTLARVWAQGGRNLEEIQAIAQEVLSRKAESPLRRATPEGMGVGGGGGGGGGSCEKMPQVDAGPCIEGLDSWSNPAMGLGSADPLSTYWSLSNDFQPDIPVWFSSY